MFDPVSILFEPRNPIKRVFLCGKITGDPNYQAKFARAAQTLEAKGFAVMNPAVLPPQGFEHRQYLAVTLAMLSVCDALMFLEDWTSSTGAKQEMRMAELTDKPGFSYKAWLRRAVRDS